MSRETVHTNQNEMLDEYCIWRLAKEVSSDYEDEMIKAQAVIVRTTVYRDIKEIEAETLATSDLDKAWYKRLKEIWKTTEGQVILYQEELALLPFHKLSNGQTRSGEEVLGSKDYPYLKVKDCAKDIGADEQMQTQVISLNGAQVTEKDSAGYVTEVKIGVETCSGDSFRKSYDLPSSCFELQEFDNKTRVITRGVGHGLGMSQYMANEMAKEGKTYQEILQYFFEGTEIREVAEILWDTE